MVAVAAPAGAAAPPGRGRHCSHQARGGPLCFVTSARRKRKWRSRVRPAETAASGAVSFPVPAMAVRASFENNNELGCFAKLTNAYCLVAIGGSENFYR